MAVPKNKTSQSRKNMRRSHHRVSTPPIIRCSRCSSKVELHTICAECGYYRGKPIIQVEEV